MIIVDVLSDKCVSRKVKRNIFLQKNVFHGELKNI